MDKVTCSVCRQAIDLMYDDEEQPIVEGHDDEFSERCAGSFQPPIKKRKKSDKK